MSKIQWTDVTWNPVIGCSRVSEGCRNCYAERHASRLAGNPLTPGYAGIAKDGRWTGRVELVPEKLIEPLAWRKPRRVFVNSMSDLFHESLPDAEIDKVFAVMLQAPMHTFQVLTKRAERMRAYLSNPWLYSRLLRAVDMGTRQSSNAPNPMIGVSDPSRFPAKWIWLGVSCEDQKTADERVPLLLQTSAAVRFVSLEPLLGPIDLRSLLGRDTLDPFSAAPPVDWVIIGGESGPGARPCDVAWIRDIIRQCKTAGVPCFVKQLGAYVADRNDAGFEGVINGDDRKTSWPHVLYDEVEHDIRGYREEYQGAPVRVRLHDRKGGDPSEWPEDLRVREVPHG